MKHKLLFATAAILAIAACSKKEIIENNGQSAPDITASIINDSPNVKTSISVDQEGVGTIWWQPGDKVNIFFDNLSVPYISTNTEPATTVVFTTTAMMGSTESASTNRWGLYPHDENATCDGSNVTTTIPSVQYAVPDTFDNNTFTMLGHSTDNFMTFYNVCGGIKFSLSRDDIQKITFKGNNNEDIAGKVKLKMDSNNHPEATVSEGEKTIILTPKNGTNFAKNTNYYIIALPASMTKGFTMTFETLTQIGTFSYADKAVTISRSKFGKKACIDTYANFIDKPTPAIDLSASGTANCYVISTGGTYKFKTVQGNSTSSVGEVKGVKVLWETFGTDVTPTVGDLINPYVLYKDNYITFSTNSAFKEGNAVIAAYSDANCTEGNVLWSWHIWLTDLPGEQIYNNNAGIMMDRNLGATSATPGDVHALGLLYQWGRKDPFLSGCSISSNNISAASTIIWPNSVEATSQIGTVNYATSHPTTYIKHKFPGHDWKYEADSNLWNSDFALYDPCPQGWRVPNETVWTKAFGKDAYVMDKNTSKKGVNFGKWSLSSYYQLGEDSTIWYPWPGYINGIILSIGYNGTYWSRHYDIDGAYCLDIDYGTNKPSCSVKYRDYAASVRCQKIQ